jgi:hypothetical protein
MYFTYMLLLLKEENEFNPDTHRHRLEYCRRRDQRIPRPSLLMPLNSPWEMILRSGNDQSLITLSGFDNRLFHLLHDMFEPVFDTHL